MWCTAPVCKHRPVFLLQKSRWEGNDVREINEAEEEADMQRKGKRKIMAAVAVGVISVSFYGWWSKTQKPEPEAVVSRATVVEAARKEQGEVVVYVSGRVEHPGVIRVSAGARAIDVVNAAGGLLSGADVSKVNLAQSVKDGMQINVPGQPIMAGEASAGKYPGPGNVPGRTGSSSSGNKSTEEKININIADASELDKLPGVGPAMAEKIVEWRKTNGPFQDGEELKKVKGIGEEKYRKLKDKISW